MRARVRWREFIGLLVGAAAWPGVAPAQQADRGRRIGVLMTITAADPQAQSRLATFRSRLEQLGWTDSRNVQIEPRFGGGDPERISKFAAELVVLQSGKVALAQVAPAAQPESISLLGALRSHCRSLLSANQGA